MGAVPVLLALAAVGVDYGWQPDGTASARGDNIEYIVQISPEQLQQIRSLGEITSAIDPAVQGRVSRIVVRVGSGPLPRIAGRVAANQTAQLSPLPSVSRDEDVVPIPEISTALAARATPANALRETADRVRSAEVMKPDPQGGFQMPDSLKTDAQSALDQVRSRANDALNQVDANARSAIEAPINTLNQAASDVSRRATSTLQSGFDSLTNPAASAGGNQPFANPAAADPRVSTDPVGGSSFGSRGFPNSTAANSSLTSPPLSNAASQGPSTAPIDPNARAAAWPGFTGPTQPSDPRALANPYGGTSATGNANPASEATIPPSPYARTTVDPYANPASTRGATDPTDPNWTGYGTGGNFGAAPSGLNFPRSQVDNASQAATTASGNVSAQPPYNPNAAANLGPYANAQPGYLNSAGQQVDRNGYPLISRWNDPTIDSRVANNPAYTPPSFGNSGDANTPNTYLQPGTTSGNTSLTAQQQWTLAQQEKLQWERDQYAQELEKQRLANQQLADRQLAQQRAQATRFPAGNSASLVNYDEEALSPSDANYVATSRAATEARERAAAAAVNKPRVAAQPFFNFVLLISLVGNAYLIFETNNLRRKFRNMISSMRSSKVSAQAAI